MDEARLRALLREFKNGQLGAEDVISELSVLPYQDLGFAKIDHHRALRKGFPEVVFGQGKTPDQIAAIATALLGKADRLLVTKTTLEAFSQVKASIPDADYDETARAIVVDRTESREMIQGVAVACAGTSDLPVAREAALTAELMGCEVQTFNDVGVAGIQRLFDSLPDIGKARALVVVAGMDGALPSVVGGLVCAPVIAVPTSVGYGASFDGLAALLAMLNSCAPGVAVVNINNGFGAGYLAALIVKVN